MICKKNHLLLTGLCSSIFLLAACQPNNTEEANDAVVTTEQQSATDIQEAAPADEHAHHDMHAMAADADNEVTQAYMQGMAQMHDDMMAGMMANDPDVAFAKGMLPHHEGAVAMAQVQLKYGKDATMRKLAEDIIQAQQAEIELMKNWISEHS